MAVGGALYASPDLDLSWGACTACAGGGRSVLGRSVFASLPSPTRGSAFRRTAPTCA